MQHLIRYALMGLTGAIIFVLVTLGLGWLFGARTGADFSTFGQFVVDLILMPAVVVTFLITIYEFRKLQAKPEVDLFFEGFTKEAVIVKPKRDSTLSHPNLILYNTGDKIALWYMVVITVPLELDREPGLTMGAEMGRRATIRDEGKLTQEDIDNTRIFKFRSEGETAVYTKYPLGFGMLRIMMAPNKTYHGSYEVTYTIANDWGEPVKGRLRLRVEEQK